MITTTCNFFLGGGREGGGRGGGEEGVGKISLLLLSSAILTVKLFLHALSIEFIKSKNKRTEAKPCSYNTKTPVLILIETLDCKRSPINKGSYLARAI